MNKILENIKPVVEKAKYVRINQDNLRKVCLKSAFREMGFWMDSLPFEPPRLDEKEKLAFHFVFESINFSYWGEPKWTIEHQGKKFDGAWAMIASLCRAKERGIPILDARFLSSLREEGLRAILDGNVPIPLFQERVKILRENGEILKRRYKGIFENVIREASGDALKLLDLIVSNFSSFNDYAYYYNKPVFFYKRAQLLISDIYRAFVGKDFGAFINIDQLTAFADYKIPQVLRKLGILEYSKDLAEKVDNKVLIEEGSEEEIEIRASMIWAIELMKQVLKNKIPNIKAMDIDSYLWLKGQEKSPKDRPYHLTRTIFY